MQGVLLGETRTKAWRLPASCTMVLVSELMWNSWNSTSTNRTNYPITAVSTLCPRPLARNVHLLPLKTVSPPVLRHGALARGQRSQGREASMDLSRGRG